MPTVMGDNLFVKAAIDHEREMARLYNTFDKYLPDGRGIWKRMAEEEEAQAQLMEELEEARKHYEVELKLERLPTSQFVMSINQIRGHIETVCTIGMPFAEAVEVARQMESKPAEQEIYEAFIPKTPQLVTDIQTIYARNRYHLELLDELEELVPADQAKALKKKKEKRQKKSFFFWRN